MQYQATRPDENHAWLISASDGTGVIALPFDLPELVAKAVAAAFESEMDRLLIGDGVSGQDRESYTDEQDRENYTSPEQCRQG